MHNSRMDVNDALVGKIKNALKPTNDPYIEDMKGDARGSLDEPDDVDDADDDLTLVKCQKYIKA